ncbi:MAG: CotH kinase family protein [Myxococcales bacterium]|nr:CotH kinase family protein [Myxococcales bacterium]
MLGLAVTALAAGCGGDDAAADPDGGLIDAGPDAPDPTAAIYDPAHVVEVAIELPVAAWDDIRSQQRPADVLFGADCQDRPFGSPFTSHLGTVTVDGVRLEQVAVRKKGFLGSLDDTKPSLKLKFDEVVVGQEVAGVRGLTLNNNKQDPSVVRQCLAYRRFAAAGIPAPRCNYAHVTVNGLDLGVFTNVEGVNKRFLARHFASDAGRLYEGTLADFRPGWLATFEPKTDEANPDRSDLEAVATALTAPDPQLLAALAPAVDVERFLTFWAMETLLEHGDGYANNTNNYFVYADPTSGQLQFLPWGTDSVAGAPGVDPPASVMMANGLLARRLYLLPETRARYVARMQALLAGAWDVPAILADLDRDAALIAPYLPRDPFAVGVDVTAEIAGVRAFVQTRAARIAPTLAAPPTWDRPLRASFCFVELGPIQATFATTFKAVDPPDVFTAGAGTLTGSIEGVPITPTRVGTNAAPADGGQVAIQVFGLITGSDVLVAVINLPPAQVTAGATVPIPIFSAFVFRFNPVAGTGAIVGVLIGGTVSFTQGAGATDGAPVVGSWSSTLYSSPF